MMNSYRSKKDIIYENLKENIIKGVYKPGARLVIDELAKTMNASQIPIREALQNLEADGFISIEPYVGARVSEISASFIFEVFDLLRSMEIISSRKACETMSDAELETLSHMIMEMDQSIDDPVRWSEQNKTLHIFICDCAETSLVKQMLTKVIDHWERLRLHYLKDIAHNRIPQAQKEHKLLLAAMRSRDPDAVEEILREHNQSALKSYTQHLVSQGHNIEQEG